MSQCPPPPSLPLSSQDPPPRKITRPDAREWQNFEFIIRHQAYDFQQHKYLGSSGNLDLWSFVTIFQNVDKLNGDLAKNTSENSVPLAFMTDLNNEMSTSSVRSKNLLFHSPVSILLGYEIWSLPFINQKNKKNIAVTKSILTFPHLTISELAEVRQKRTKHVSKTYT